jgi:hypothetical protein
LPLPEQPANVNVNIVAMINRVLFKLRLRWFVL